MILSICDNSSVLSALRVVRILIMIIKIVVPIILIVTTMLNYMAAVSSNDNDALTKANKNIIPKIIAAILIFFIPTFINIIADATSNSVDFMKCISEATSEGISKAKYNETINLVAVAEKRMSESDYKIALTNVNNLEDSSDKNALISRLNKVKDGIELKKEIDIKMKNPTEEGYNELLKKVNALEDGEFKNQLLKKLEEMKKKLVGNVNEVLAKISSYAPKKYKDNITINYYVSSSNQGFTYWLYVPSNVSAGLPIVFFMHDLGCRGDDYHNGTDASIWGGPIREINQGNRNYNAILVHAQVPSGDRSQNYSSSYIELLNKLADGFKADKKKISVMGFSNGCYGVMTIVSQNPNYFSSAVPIGCSTSGSSPSSFKNLAYWSFVGTGDGAGDMPSFANSINSIGGNAKHSNSKYKSHNCLYPSNKEGVLLEYNVVEWMLNQTKK